MFQTTLPQLIVYILVALLGLLSLVWAGTIYGIRRRERKALQFRIACVICGTNFDDFSKEPLVKCPKCGRLNERDRVVEL